MSSIKAALSKPLWSACLGNFLEHYDTALFGFLSVFLAPLIFPKEDQITALILTYAMIPLGMLARPIGALVLGYIGDIYGRKHALFLSLGGMSLVTTCIALSPTYDQAGFFAPLIFCLGRILQNFLSAGETMGGAIFLLENSPEERQDLLSGLYSATTIGGILFASLGVALMSHYDAIDWGWRLLYLLGSLTAVFGIIIRRQIPSHTWNHSPVIPSQSLLNLGKTLWTHRKALLLIAIGSGFSYANYSVALILINGFIPIISPFSHAEMMHLNTYLLVLDFCALPFFGWLSSKIKREKIMLGASLGVAIVGIILFKLLPQASFISIVAIRIFLVICGVAFSAPYHAWAQQLVTPAHRYVVISLGYALGSQMLGGPTAALSLWIYNTAGIASSIAWYWVALAILSSLALTISIKSSKKNIQALQDPV